MADVAPYRREIETLHEFFVDWYAGDVPESAFDRMDAAMAPDFAMVSAGNGRVSREEIVGGVRADYDRDEPADFEIDIRDVELLASGPDHAVVQYEEWQRIEGDWEGRVSVAILREDPAGPEGIVWSYVQSTMLDD